jgi:hypothetical protein
VSLAGFPRLRQAQHGDFLAAQLQATERHRISSARIIAAIVAAFEGQKEAERRWRSGLSSRNGRKVVRKDPSKISQDHY